MTSIVRSISLPQSAKLSLRWVPLVLILAYILFAWSYPLGSFVRTTSPFAKAPTPSLDPSSPSVSSTIHQSAAQPDPTTAPSKNPIGSIPVESGDAKDVLHDNSLSQSIETKSLVHPITASSTVSTPTSTRTTPTPSSASESKTLASSPASTNAVTSSRPFAFSQEERLRIATCSQISGNSLRALQKKKSTSVFTFFNGDIVEKGSKLTNPAKICILVAVPQQLPAAKLFPESPVPGKWPDNLHLSLSSASVKFSIPPLRPLPAQPNANQLFSSKAILYYAELELKHEGVYHVDVESEAPSWLWAMHGWREATPTVREANQEILEHMRSLSSFANFTAAMAANKLLQKPVRVPKDQKFPADITLSGRPPKTEVPFCYNFTELDMNRGRWFRQQKYPHIRNETADEHGFSFDLDDCHLDYFDDRDTIDCLSNKAIQVFGDSNARRLSRVIMSGGRWCHDVQDKCQGEDHGSPVRKVMLTKSGRIFERPEPKKHGLPFEIGDHNPFLFGNSSKLWFSFFTSLAYSPGQWLEKFYPHSQYKIPKKRPKEGARAFRPNYLLPGAKARPQHAPETPDLVIISMSSWDDAFDLEYRAYERALIHFRDAVMEAYPAKQTRLFLRLNQGYCCRRNFRPSNMRRFTGTRLQHFGDIARRVFQVEGASAMQGRMRVLDVAALTGRPEVVRVYTQGQLSSNHQRAAHVRVEGQVLLNSICERDASGKAKWKT